MSAETAFFIATPAPLAVTDVTPTSLTVRCTRIIRSPFSIAWKAGIQVGRGENS